MTSAFFDTNVIVYGYSARDPKALRSRSLIAEGGKISVQTLNEFANVARRKLRWEWVRIEDVLADLREIFDAVIPVDNEVHQCGIELAQRYGFSVYDAMIVSAALIARCDRLYSEDMHDGLVVNGTLTIENPFRGVG